MAELSFVSLAASDMPAVQDVAFKLVPHDHHMSSPSLIKSNRGCIQNLLWNFLHLDITSLDYISAV